MRGGKLTFELTADDLTALVADHLLQPILSKIEAVMQQNIQNLAAQMEALKSQVDAATGNEAVLKSKLDAAVADNAAKQASLDAAAAQVADLQVKLAAAPQTDPADAAAIDAALLLAQQLTQQLADATAAANPAN